MKYIKRENKSLDEDFQYYLARENLFHFFFGHKLNRNQRRKVNYIWRKLLYQQRY